MAFRKVFGLMELPANTVIITVVMRNGKTRNTTQRTFIFTGDGQALKSAVENIRREVGTNAAINVQRVIW